MIDQTWGKDSEFKLAASRPAVRSAMGVWTRLSPLRVRAISMDVTGTLLSFRGSLKTHYLGSALKCGVKLSESAPIEKAFGTAYKEMCTRYPCFGYNVISGKEWWKRCVMRSLELAGAPEMDHELEERVFQRIYSIFGSQLAYERFEDALPFIHWAGRHGVSCGLLSNADDRYGDSILPMLGLTPDELQFQCFSKDYGIEKPNPRFFRAALHAAESTCTDTSAPLRPSEMLHIGNDYTKDFEAARQSGMHAVLLNRYNENDLAEEWKRRGAIVLKDLMDVVEFLGRSDCRLG